MVGTKFRQWATKTLRGYIVDGYAINKKQIAKNYVQFAEAVDAVKKLLPKGTVIDNESVLKLISLFADTWLSLDAYDKDALPDKGPTKKRVSVSGHMLAASIAELKIALIAKGEATDMFATERTHDAITGILGNVMQSFGGTPVYDTVEE